MSCIEMFRNLFPIPNETHIMSAPISLKNGIPSTIMSVSFAITSVRLYPCDTAFAACNTRVSYQCLAQNSSIHFHPEMILQPFLNRRRYEQWLLTDNGTVLPCYLRSAGKFQFLGNFPFPSCSFRPQHMHHMGTINQSAVSFIKVGWQSTSKQESKSDFWPILRMPCLDRDG